MATTATTTCVTTDKAAAAMNASASFMQAPPSRPNAQPRSVSSNTSPSTVLQTASRLLQSRVGREMQRYDGATRLLACVVVLRKRKRNDTAAAASTCRHDCAGTSEKDATQVEEKSQDLEQQVLVISSSKHPSEWILPKGGWESDETLIECALREAEEEAGIAGEVVRELGTLDFASKEGKRCRFHGFQLAVCHEYQTWAESNRQRQWVSIADARKVLSRRPELLEMLNRATS